MGTGVTKIMGSYEHFGSKPKIETTDNAFKIVLPNINETSAIMLNENEGTPFFEQYVIVKMAVQIQWTKKVPQLVFRTKEVPRTVFQMRKLTEQKLLEVEAPFIRRIDLGIDVSNMVLSEFLLD